MKREYCKFGRHKMEGRNVITRADGSRCCRACQYERNKRHQRAKRRPRMRWGKFSIEELGVMRMALSGYPLIGLQPYQEISQFYQCEYGLFKELDAFLKTRGPEENNLNGIRHQRLQ